MILFLLLLTGVSANQSTQAWLPEPPAIEPHIEDFLFDADCTMYSPDGIRGRIQIRLTDVMADHSAKWSVTSDKNIFSFGDPVKAEKYVHMYNFVYFQYDGKGDRTDYRILLQDYGAGQKFEYWSGAPSLGEISIVKWKKQDVSSKVRWRPAAYLGTGSCKITATKVRT